MPFIKVALKDAQESEVVPEGEYDLRIAKAEDKDSKKGNPMTQVMIVIDGHPNAQPVNHFLLYPTKNDDENITNLRLRDTRRFLELFGIEWTPDGFDTDDLVGATARGFLGQEEGDDGNMYNRLRPPRLKTEEKEEETRRPAVASGGGSRRRRSA